MADGDEPIRPRPPVPPAPGQPLPRLWKVEPEAESGEVEKAPRGRQARLAAEKEEREAKAAAEAPKGKSKPKREPERKPSAKSKVKGKGVLVEETPELDTYETRRRARLLLGGLIAAVALISVIFVYNSLQGPTISEEGLVDEGGPPPGGVASAPAAPAPATQAKVEQEATNLLGTARQLARNGKAKQATVILERVAKSYPKTAAASSAKKALGRPAKNLPLFLDEDVVVASTATKAKPAGPQVMEVDDANASVVPPGAPGDASLRLNPNPAEAPKAPAPAGNAKATVAARPLPPGFRIEDESGVHPSGWPYQIVSDRDGAVMVLVPAGVYVQGRDDGSPDEAPAHKVRLRAFYVDQHEVTARQFDLYLKETGRRRVATRTATKDGAGGADDAEEPITNVSALEAKAYCEWAGKRLPTEAQWEAAARSGDGRTYPWGGSEPVWSRPRVPRQIDPVGSFPLDQSQCGALDLAGNAWEWTQDWFDSKYYQQINAQIADDPAGPVASRAKPPQVVVKGGSKLWVAAWREGLRPDTKLPYVGFRGVLPLEAAPATPAATAPPATKNGTPPPNRGGIVPF